MECVLGDVIAGIWQYMCQPWGSFRELVFDIIFQDAGGWDYIGYGRIDHFAGQVASIENISQSTDV